MTTKEFSDVFDIHYDNIANKNAPGLDLYEKSVFLTKAQLEIIKNHYTPKGNKYQKGFEASEKRRVDLKELIKDYKTNTTISSTDNISSLSKFYEIPENVFLIIREEAVLSSTDICINGKTIEVVPKTYDEYSTQIKNPFKNPDENKAWRLDYSRIDSKKVVEIISKYDIASYNIRYLKYPNPIILTDLDDGDFIGMNLSIDGATAAQTCELDVEIHREIVDRAVEIAVRDYKQADLQSKVQLNLRNE